jgi:lipopolysaccharide transport system ATP-binding protein
MSRGDIAISLDSVSVEYRKVGSWLTQKEVRYTALKNISFNLYQGESLAVIGRNGAGKSTLLKLLASVILPDTGQISNKGYSTALMALNVGLMPELSGLDNIFIVGTLMGYRRREVAEHVDEIIAFAELEPFINNSVKTYSAGMKSRLGFAIASIMQADVLLIDEVLSVGDRVFQKKSAEVIRQRLQSDQTVVLVSHSESAIRQYCTHALWIEDGEVKMHDEVGVVMDAYEKS